MVNLSLLKEAKIYNGEKTASSIRLSEQDLCQLSWGNENGVLSEHHWIHITGELKTVFSQNTIHIQSHVGLRMVFSHNTIGVKSKGVLRMVLFKNTNGVISQGV